MTEQQTNQSNWIVSIVSLVSALIVGAIAIYFAWKAGKEKAKLLHDQDVAVEQQRQADMEAITAEKDEVAANALAQAQKLQENIDALQEKIHAEDLKRDQALDRINAITSWSSFVVRRDSADPNTHSNPIDL